MFTALAEQNSFMTTTPTAIVDAFIRAVCAKDLATAGALVAENISYENVPMAPIVGRAATVEALERFLLPASEVDWPVHRQLSDGTTVINERTDRFRFPGGWLELPVVGVFEVHDGKITLWRDYFDLGMFQRGIAAVTSSG